LAYPPDALRDRFSLSPSREPDPSRLPERECLPAVPFPAAAEAETARTATLGPGLPTSARDIGHPLALVGVAGEMLMPLILLGPSPRSSTRMMNGGNVGVGGGDGRVELLIVVWIGERRKWKKRCIVCC
jgi:hypothetical protein